MPKQGIHPQYNEINVKSLGFQVPGTERDPQAEILDVPSLWHADPDGRRHRCAEARCGKRRDQGELHQVRTHPARSAHPLYLVKYNEDHSTGSSLAS